MGQMNNSYLQSKTEMGDGRGLADIARYVNQRILNTRLLNAVRTYDTVISICQAHCPPRHRHAYVTLVCDIKWHPVTAFVEWHPLMRRAISAQALDSGAIHLLFSANRWVGRRRLTPFDAGLDPGWPRLMSALEAKM